MAERQKINWLLILQGWAMLWVVIGHSGPSATFEDYPIYATFIWNTAYSFHMALFISISGFLFYLTRLDNEKWTYWATLKEKLIRFGIPFVVFTIVALLMKYFFAGSVDRATTLSVREFVNAIIYPYNGPMREFWFLATIMWYFAFFPLWKFLLRKKWLSFMALCCFVFLNICYPESDLFALGHVCEYSFFFFGGILCARLFKGNSSIITNRFFIPATLIGGGIVYVVGRLNNIPFITPLGGAIMSLSIALILEKINPRTFFSFRNYTYQIYLMGIWFNVFITIIRTRLGLPFGPMYVVSLLLGLYMPVLISKMIEKIGWKVLKMTVGLK